MGGDNDAPQESIEKKLQAWLDTEGYPLEFRTARILERAGFSVLQGRYVREPKGEKPREVDVIATRRATSDARLLVEVGHIVECKSTRDKPWIVFSSPRPRMHPRACIAQTISDPAGHALLWTVAQQEELCALDLFTSPEKPGFNGRQAFSKVDTFYEACQAICSKAHQYAVQEAGFDTPDRYISCCSIAFPMIVIDGRLFSAGVEDGSDDLALKEVPYARLHWSGAERWKLHSTIDIVTVGALERFAALRIQETDLLLKHLETAMQHINDAYEFLDMSRIPLLSTPGASRNLPRLYRELERTISTELFARSYNPTKQEADRPAPAPLGVNNPKA